MEILDAARLIRFQTNAEDIQLWADLGCGTGTFTYALASLLPPQSTIYAVDQNEQNLQEKLNEVAITFIESDFTLGIDSMPDLHGVLMANSLHYIKDKRSLISNIRQKLIRGKRQLLVVEYETEFGNTWAPFPITYSQLKELANQLGAVSIDKLGTIPSRYHGEMYAAMIRFS